MDSADEPPAGESQRPPARLDARDARRSRQSFLLAKITDNLAAGEGAPMPYNTAPLDDATIEIIRAWIAAGAPADGRRARRRRAAARRRRREPGEIILPPPARGVQLAITARRVPVGHGRDRVPLPEAAVRRRSRRQPHPDQRQRRQPPHPSLSPVSTARSTCPTASRCATWRSTSTSGRWSSPRSCARPTGSCRRASRSTSAPASSCWCRRTSSTSARWRPTAKARC